MPVVYTNPNGNPVYVQQQQYVYASSTDVNGNLWDAWWFILLIVLFGFLLCSICSYGAYDYYYTPAMKQRKREPEDVEMVHTDQVPRVYYLQPRVSM